MEVIGLTGSIWLYEATPGPLCVRVVAESTARSSVTFVPNARRIGNLRPESKMPTTTPRPPSTSVWVPVLASRNEAGIMLSVPIWSSAKTATNAGTKNPTTNERLKTLAKS